MIDVARPRPAITRHSRTRALSDLVRHVDWVLMFAIVALVAYGLWAIGGITRFDVPGDPDYFVVRQGIAVAVGAVGFVIAFAVPTSLLQRYWKLVYASTLLMMVLVFLLAEAIRGSKRWLDIGPFQFQPSELGKTALVIAVAGFLCSRASRMGEWSTIVSALALAALPMGLVFLQPDLGTALVYAAGVTGVLFVGGVRWSHLAVLGAAAAVTVLAVLWFLPAAGVEVLKPYQAERLTGFTNPDLDPSGATYNVDQSITAIGSGGLDGRGVLGATQTRLDYLPEHATDFVFAAFAEQRGFFGAAILLLLYLLVVWRGLRIITVAPDFFGSMVAGGIVVALLFQVFVNVGMTMGVAPVTGIPLPFFTVGGSSIVANLIAFGVLQGIHARATVQPRR